MNQRSYESAPKDLLEEVASLAEINYSASLRKLYMPTNVEGVEPITVSEWLDARWEKKNR